MLAWAIVFLVVALLAGIMGFAFLAGTIADIAKLFFLVFAIAFLLVLFMWRGR